MRIFHAVSSAKDAHITLGTENEVVILALAQKARGSDVMIAIDRQGVFMETCQEHGIPVIVNDCLGASRRPGAMAPEENVVQDFIELLQKFSPDIIHCHTSRAALVAITAGNRMNIPCVFTCGNPQIAIEGGRVLRFATLCLTAAGLEELQRSGIPDTDLYYIPSGTRIVAPTQAQQTGVSHSSSLILAGSLAIRKGVDIAILAMVQLRRRLGSACPSLNIYGDGPRRKYLTEMAAVLELNDIVRFHGFELGILEHCPSSDVLVMPSREELGPLVILEAMSRGMPIVATDVGEVTKMLPDLRYGHVIPPDSAIALADGIESLLADIAGGRFNPDLLIERHRSLYSVEKRAERMEAAYNQIMLNSSAAV
jgi:glycosyltransferase involved in cell wall biosynthesis